MNRTIKYAFLFSILCTCLNAADTLPADTTSAPVEEEALPIVPERAVSQTVVDEQLNAAHRALLRRGCKVAPLAEIDDPDALAFENDAESAAADVKDLTPDTAQALDTFKEMVTSAGGSFELKSAYRSPAYQAHLHDVWVKWVKELRNNRATGCQALREEVGAEFKRHQLLVRQQPVPDSDHALGVAFDAAVAMPRGARRNRRRVTVDRLAALAGIRRPNSRRDPVHFILIPQRTAAGD